MTKTMQQPESFLTQDLPEPSLLSDTRDMGADEFGAHEPAIAIPEDGFSMAFDDPTVTSWSLGDGDNAALELEMASPFDVDLIAAGVAHDDEETQGRTHDRTTQPGHCTTMPPERVKFAVPVSLRPEGSDDVSYDGAVVNLSTHGVACLSPVDLSPGERVWATFRLGLAEKPLTFLCEAIWARPPEEGYFSCGLRFKSLTRAESDQIQQTVRERTEGRAGEWPLPVLPDEIDSGVSRSGANPWLTAAAGMAAGVVLALIASVMPPSEATAEEIASAPVRAMGAQAAADVTAPGLTEVSSPAPIVEAVAPAALPALDADDSSALVAQGTVAATSGQLPADKPTQVTAVAQPKKQPEPVAAKSKHLPRLDAKKPAPKGDYLRPTGSEREMSVALLADGIVDQHVEFWLSNPRRLVIDIPARRSGFAKNEYMIEHRVASRLRIGNHKDKVRYVIEVSEDAKTEYEARATGSALVVTLRR